MRMVRVPMAVDAKLKIPVGPVNLPIRAVLCLVVAAPLAYIGVEYLPGMYRYVVPIVGLILAAMLGMPEQESVWILTFAIYKVFEPLLPRIIRGGLPGRVNVKRVGSGLSVGRPRRQLAGIGSYSRWVKQPRITDADTGLLYRRPGGWCGVIRVTGPDAAPHTDAYADWCKGMTDWLLNIEVPVQVLARTVHYDRSDVEAKYERHCTLLQTRLGDYERRLSGDIASRTMVVEHHVVLLPRLAGKDGMPTANSILRLSQAQDCPRTDAERAVQTALRLASTFGIEVRASAAEEIEALASETVLGTREAVNCGGLTFANGTYHAYLAVNALPPKLTTGSIVSAMMRARIQGSTSLHLLPVDVVTARTHLNRQRQAYRYASQHSSDIDVQMMAADTEALIAALAGRQVQAVRAGLVFSVEATSMEGCEESLQRLHAALAGEGLRGVQVTTPGFIAANATSLGGTPLQRNLLMTTDVVIGCLLPAVGTPFGDPAQPLVGINASTGSPVYLDVFRRANHNAVIVGTSGAGKSVSCKSMLLRHAAQGARTIVIDPDSEYGLIMSAIGGTYVELGEASINVLAVDPGTSADEAAGLVIPVLSVMGGEEVGYKDGRPIRRLRDADKAWLHQEIVAFFLAWREMRGEAEPVLTDLCNYLERYSVNSCTTDALRERCRDISLRLRGYTQGSRARIFNRPSSFSLDQTHMAIGLRELSLQFRADITPAMAITLTRILDQLRRREGKLVILVDEAHRVTSDPDAGSVLDQLVRQARKYGAGVWMASQSVDDFVRTELGRILAATAATKFILGIEQTVAEDAQQVFGLADHEMSALTPRFVPGRGVLISGHERAVVQVWPGDHLMPLVSTSMLPEPVSGAA